MNGTLRTNSRRRASLARRQFCIAWLFLLLTAASGVLLRLAGIGQLEWPPYGNLLHTHSHIAFLGWVFNAFFALATRFWIPERRLASFHRLFWILQVANFGMLLSFPVQGYGPASIAFSTLHVGGSIAFAAVLWRVRVSSPTALAWLRLALVFMLLSGAGPFVLGPLAAMDLRDSAAYPMSIYWYLHFQYNGWFVTFLMATGVLLFGRPFGAGFFGRMALPVFALGVFLTYLISAFWLAPAPWVYALGALGAILQLAIIFPIARMAAGEISVRWKSLSAIPRFLLLFARGAIVCKCLLQLAACWPGLHDLVHHRYTVIAFLHLVFLMVVLPVLLAAAWQLGWIGPGEREKTGLWILGSGVLGGQTLLVWPTLGAMVGLPLPVAVPDLLLVAAILNLIGLLLLRPRRARIHRL